MPDDLGKLLLVIVGLIVIGSTAVYGVSCVRSWLKSETSITSVVVIEGHRYVIVTSANGGVAICPESK